MSDLFNFVAETGVMSDETTGYRIKLSREVTVKEVIDEILDRQTYIHEWGHLNLNNCGIYDSIDIGEFGTRCKPKLEDEVKKFPEWLLNAKVVQMKACGGWSRMDYYVWIYPPQYGEDFDVKEVIDDFKEPYDAYIAELNKLKEVSHKEVNMSLREFADRLLDGENLSDDTKKILKYEMGKILGEETVTIGGYEYDGHVYEDVEEYPDCTVIVSKCIKCGKIDISWRRNDGQEY